MEREVLFSLSKAAGDFVVKTARSSGPGGQNVNKRDTKIHISHPASGAKSVCQTHRTQEKNRAEAFRRLVGSDVFQAWLRVELARRGISSEQERVGGPTGSRGEKVRTYNFPRDEVTDHRVGLTVRGVKSVLGGDIDAFVDALRVHGQSLSEGVAGEGEDGLDESETYRGEGVSR
jgi:peptide chain release factor 1